VIVRTLYQLLVSAGRIVGQLQQKCGEFRRNRAIQV